MSKRAVLIAITIIGTAVAALTVRGQEQDLKTVLSVSLAAETRNGMTMLRTTFGPGVTRALRVYSEPSHTLLGIYMNNEVPQPVHRAWLDEVEPQHQTADRFPMMQMPIREGVKAAIQALAAPSTDEAVKIVIFGAWAEEDGVVREREIPVTVSTSASQFSFTFRRVVGEVADRGEIGAGPRGSRQSAFPRTSTVRVLDVLCCGPENGGCSRACASCKPGSDFACCNENGAGCPWCGKALAACLLECPAC
jgi:hypothetical protein